MKKTDIKLTPDMFVESEMKDFDIHWTCGCATKNICTIKLQGSPQEIKCKKCDLSLNITLSI